MMGDSRLYEVSSNGETTPPSDPPSPSGPAPRRAPQKARPKYAVPTDRMRFDVQVQALRVIASASRGGTEPVDANKMGTLMGITPATAVLNNAFFASIGLIERTGKGDYKPSDLTLEFQREFSFKKDAAGPVLAPAFKGTWFLEAIGTKLEVSDAATRDDMIEVLASVAETDNSYATQYGSILDWLKYVGLITMNEGFIQIVGARSAIDIDEVDGKDQVVERRSEDDEASDVGNQVDIVKPTSRSKEKQESDRGPAMVSISFDVEVTAEDLARLSPEQISSLFEGLGRLAAVKSALNS